MNDLSVFSFTNYKKYLSARLKNSWGLITKLAEAAGCQRAYLSRVLNSHVQLTPDHAYNICIFFELNPSETDYFVALVECERAGTKTYREFMEKKVKELRREHQNLSSRLQRQNISVGEKEASYYSSWYWSAIHILVSIGEFQNPETISKRLQLPISLVRSTLETLARYGLVKYERGRWVHSSGDLHLPRNSPFVAYHHNNWRARAVSDAQMQNKDNIHFTIVQAMSREAMEEIKELILDFIDESAKVAGPSQSEEILCTNLDFFTV